jgi:glycerol-3-phosphate acyltransferase PlsX
MITISVDCMGGDHGPHVTLPACTAFLDQHPDAQLIVVGLPESLKGYAHARARLVPASEVVSMDDPLEVALRRKKDSSMRVAIAQVKGRRRPGSGVSGQHCGADGHFALPAENAGWN